MRWFNLFAGWFLALGELSIQQLYYIIWARVWKISRVVLIVYVAFLYTVCTVVVFLNDYQSSYENILVWSIITWD